jgi:aspartyl-tRNA(Asn)/glutamyl-tRNA(Gln) amidotransferase subunit C
MSDAAIDIDHLAKLARIALSDSEKQRFAGELVTVVRYFGELQGVDTEGVEPSAHAFPVFNVLREDTADTAGILDAAALEKIAPAFREEQVLVPRVVDDEG